jgi:hypothetical protein
LVLLRIKKGYVALPRPNHRLIDGGIRPCPPFGSGAVDELNIASRLQGKPVSKLLYVSLPNQAGKFQKFCGARSLACVQCEVTNAALATSSREQFKEGLAWVNGWKLTWIAKQHNSGAIMEPLCEFEHHVAVDHGAFVDDNHVVW